MSLAVLRTGDRWYVARREEAVPVEGKWPTTAALLTDGMGAVRAASGDGVPVDTLDLRSPVTAPCRVVAQAVNYRDHAEQAGFGADPPVVFFRKSSASITGPAGEVTRPAHVRLLDYEVELGLVLGRRLELGATVSQADLPSYVAGLVVANDLSARDVQLEQGQFYEGKSYPGFTPIGPRLVLLDEGELALLPSLRLRLWVNGEPRQDGSAAGMVTGPAAALTRLARFQPMDPGDLLLTGTPGGPALRAPPAFVAWAGGALPSPLRWRVFFAREARNRAYLEPGDVVTASIATGDGAIDLGTQRSVIRG